MMNKPGPGLAHAVRALRVMRGLGQSELARRAGVQQAQVSQIERGAGNPTRKTLEALAAALDARLMLVPFERVNDMAGMEGVSAADITDPGDVFDDVFIPDDEG